MSRETTEARAELRAREYELRTHRLNCPAGKGCIETQELRLARDSAKAKLERQKQLDWQPMPGQGMLA